MIVAGGTTSKGLSVLVTISRDKRGNLILFRISTARARRLGFAITANLPAS